MLYEGTASDSRNGMKWAFVENWFSIQIHYVNYRIWRITSLLKYKNILFLHKNHYTLIQKNFMINSSVGIPVGCKT